MKILAFIILCLFGITGFAAIFFTTFGTLIIFTGIILYALLTKFAVIGTNTLVVILILYILGEVVENVFVILGGKRFGASNAAVAGAIIGGIAGAIAGAPLPGVGIVLGTFLGIFLGGFLVEFLILGDLKKAVKAGAGGIFGRIGSIAVKVVIAIVMIGLVMVRVF